MRNNIDDYIICNHTDGRAARCKIQSLEEDVEVIVVEWLTVTSELPVHVTIAQAIPKGNKIDLILQKGTELGAHDFVLFQADRSIAKWSQTKMKNRLKRFNKIVKEAAEQSHRNQLPKVNGSFTLKDLLDYIQIASYDFSLFAYEEEAKSINYSSFGKVMRKMKQGDKIIIFIGPDGGFTNYEV